MTATPGRPVHVLHEDVLDYTPYPKSVSLTRSRATRLVAEWGLSQLAGDAALLFSELPTNAVLHRCVRGRLFRVRLTLTESALRIAVCDPKREGTPSPRMPRHDEQFGRGLLIVQEVPSRWGAQDRIVGKMVWCEPDL